MADSSVGKRRIHPFLMENCEPPTRDSVIECSRFVIERARAHEGPVTPAIKGGIERIQTISDGVGSLDGDGLALFYRDELNFQLTNNLCEIDLAQPK